MGKETSNLNWPEFFYLQAIKSKESILITSQHHRHDIFLKWLNTKNVVLECYQVGFLDFIACNFSLSLLSRNGSMPLNRKTEQKQKSLILNNPPFSQQSDNGYEILISLFFKLTMFYCTAISSSSTYLRYLQPRKKKSVSIYRYL